eukprot:SAG22_NODE_2506_length_2503_cov_1.272047_1_plen_406_part_10
MSGLLTAIGRPYPAGCAVPGGVKYAVGAFAGAVPPRNWSDPSTGRVHAIHPLGCPVSAKMATPWFDWWWHLSHVQRAPALPPAPPPPPPGPAPPPQRCVHQTIQGGCCGGANVGQAHALPSYNASLCAELCCADPQCGVAVMTRDQGDVKCWLTHLSDPGTISPDPAQTVIMTRHATNHTAPSARRDGLVFGEGGWQSLQGSPVGSHFYVENIRELLDHEGEWFHDSETDTLYLWRNASLEAELGSAATFVGTLGEGVLRIVGGSPAELVVGITVSNLRIAHTTTDVLAPYEAPGGGDQSAHRGGAVYIENARNTTVVGCLFDRVDGTGVFVSRWTRDVRVANCEFSFTGSAGIIVMGQCELIDCTTGTQPHRTVIEGCFLHDGGIYSKNYLGGGPIDITSMPEFA